MIPIAKPNLRGNELAYVNKCINTGWISSNGKFVGKFEKKFAEFCDCKFASSCSSGTSALHLALLALDIKDSDEVIVPNLTFATTANVVKYCNAKPILTDVDSKSWNISPNEIKKKITPKTKAIIPVHLYGNPCEMDEIIEIANEHNLYIIEDCAEAHGAEYKNKKIGNIGHIGCFSFFGNKIITTGEGGMCTSNNKEIIDNINLLKNHGMSKEKRYWHDILGYNYRLTNIQSAIGLAQLERINEFIKKRNEIVHIYKEILENIPGIEFQKINSKSKAVYWLFSILANNIPRDNLIKKLENAEVETRKVFYPLNKMRPYLDSSEFPNSEIIAKKGVTLPTHIDLKEEQIKYICDIIKNEKNTSNHSNILPNDGGR